MTEIYEVPWMIEGGAKHTVQVARNLSFLATGGNEGVVRPTDFSVRELAIPGSSVRVTPGTAAILNRATGAQDEMYVLRVGAQETVDVSPTDSTGGRSDMLVARVKNPWAAGETWPDPDDPTVGPYADLALISDVPPNARTVDDLGLSADHTMLPLARLDIPASTGTITQNMIVDLRRLALPKRQDLHRVHNQTAGGNAVTSSAYERFPIDASWDVEIPEWATRCQVIAHTSGFTVDENSGAGGNVFGNIRTVFGSMTSQATHYNFSMPAGLGQLDSASSMAAADHHIPTAMRGTTQPLRLEANRTGGTPECVISTSVGQIVVIQVIFYQDAEQQGWDQ